ncbi:hypothetical protein BROUX41_002085 [Berkeleyomyces rouxiae]
MADRDSSYRRSRRPDSSSMWDDSERHTGRRSDRRYRSRSRDRGSSHRDGGRDRDRDREHDRETRDTRDTRDSVASPRRRGDQASQSNVRRSASPMDRPDALPTRTKPEQTAPMSFRMNGTNGSTSSHRDSAEPATTKAGAVDDEEEEELEIDVDGDGMDAMQAMLGFGGFGTTKNKKVAGNNAGGVSKEKKSQYRQYMNRVGGFNRPLSPPRE